jgi:hypothetical protein
VGVARRVGRLGWLVVGLVAVLAGPAASAGAVGLPDGRGYELVSPPEKNGSDVMASSGRVRAAADGGAVTFASLGGFGDVQGSGVAFDYMARRTGTPGTSGWVTHPLNPRQPASTLLATFNAVDSFYDGEFTPDLDCGVYGSTRPLPGVGDPADIPNLYLRNDLLDPGAGSYALLTVPLVPVDPSFTNTTVVVAISDDCSHVLFESEVPLTADTAPCTVHLDCRPKLYEWVDGTLRLAGILPDGTPAPDSVAGLGGGHYMLGMLSRDGSRVFFSVPSTGNIYMRENGTTTVQLNAGLPGGPQPSTLWIVSADGNHAFFSSNGDLYRFDATASAGSELTLITTDDASGDGHSLDGMLGVSADGSSAYFFAAGQLVAGEPLLGAGHGLYAWHDGELRFIGEQAVAIDTIPNSVNTPAGFQPLSSRVSQDGSRVLFMTRSDFGYRGRWGFPGYDHGHSCFGNVGCGELYVFDADAGSLVCVSCNPSGAPATADAFLGAASGVGASNRPVHLSHALSADGKRVFFHTAESLLPEDSNGRSDVYEYNVASASVHLISSGKDPGNSYFMDASPNGDDVFFATRERLVGWDSDQNYDLYDARVGGGLPDPVPAQPGCGGESCHGRPTAAPSPEAAASLLSTGVGDIRAHRGRKHGKRCRHAAGRRANKHRCTRRTRARHASATEKSAK